VTRVLVTGGAGFIGSHVSQRLLEEGYEVTVLDNLATGMRENVPEGAELVVADVAVADEVARAFATRSFDAVLHLAGQASIATSFSSPERDLDTNVRGTLNVLGECVIRGVPRLLYASSMTAYGEPDLVPTPEEAACVPVSYYGVSKYAAERYVQIAGDRTDTELAVTSLRMFNVYGERQSLTNPYQGVLAIFIGQLLRGSPITIHGDGGQTRDFVYVEDVVEAWMRALVDPRAQGRVYNVGSGLETSIAELAEAVLAAFGVSRTTWDVRTAPAQTGDQRRASADVARIREELGWEPSVALQDGMNRTIAWARAA
jgi:UDP-glucose 4-epimerase